MKRIINDKITVSISEMALCLGVKVRRVNQLAAEGTIPQPECRGRYPLVRTIQAYIGYLKGDFGRQKERPQTDAEIFLADLSRLKEERRSLANERRT